MPQWAYLNCTGLPGPFPVSRSGCINGNPGGRKSEASVHVPALQYSCKGLSTITWLPESHPGICCVLIKGFYDLMMVWFYSPLCVNRELPMSQDFKQQITSMNNAAFPHFPSPSPLWSPALYCWAGCDTGGSAPGPDTGWPPAAHVAQSSPLLRRRRCTAPPGRALGRIKWKPLLLDVATALHYGSGTSLCQVMYEQNVVLAPGIL